MNCKECQDRIDRFIDDSLVIEEMDKFIFHVNGCKDCMDELKVNYSLLTALKQIDGGEELSEDYDKDLEDKISAYLYRKKRKKLLKITSYVSAFLIAVILGIIIGMFTVEKNKVDYGVKDKHAVQSFVFGFDGVPDSLNPVKNAMNQYNDEIIDYLHKTMISDNE